MTQRVNKSEFLKKVAAETGHTQKDVREVYDGIVDVLVKELEDDKKVNLSQLGTFYKRLIPEREVVLNGNKNISPEHNILKFSASPKINEKLN